MNNYRDFYKNKQITEDFKGLVPEGVSKKDFNRAVTLENRQINDIAIASRIASRNLKEDTNYYKKLYEDYEQEECACEDIGDDYDENGGLPKLGGALAVPHNGRPIMMGKIVQIGNEFGGKPATGELSGMTSVGGNKGVATDKNILDVEQDGDKEPITAGGKSVNASLASHSVGGEVVSGGGQKQGGLNSQGTIASTPKPLQEQKERVRDAVKKVLKEIRFNKESGKWEKINEAKVDMKMGPSYKVVQPTLVKTSEPDQFSRTNQYDPEITEMYDDEEETKMNERYVELANSKRNLSESELTELKTLREKIDGMAERKSRNFGKSQGGVEPNLYEDEGDEKWIQKSINPKHKGYCTPMSKATCTPHRKALAKRFKKGIENEGGEEQEENFKKSFPPHFGPDWAEEEEGKMEVKNEVAPPGWEGTVKGMKKHKNIDNPWALAWSMKNKGMKSHKKEEGAVEEGRCEDYPCCGHGEGGCPDSNGNFGCAQCGATLPPNSHSSLCPRCLKKGIGDAEHYQGGASMYGDEDEMQESVVNMKMGPSYKVVQPTLAKTSEPDQFARTNQYDPEVSESQVDEAGVGAVQHSSYRTVGHGNLPQNSKQRWADDVDEGVSKVSKTIAKGQKAKSSTKSQNLKHQKPKKTSTGVHKRKT